MGCTRKNYFTDWRSTGVRLSIIPGFDNGDETVSWNCPLPFIPLAFMQGAGGSVEVIPIANVAANSAYSTTLEYIFRYLAKANMTPGVTPPGTGVTFALPGPDNPGVYGEYFTKKLDDPMGGVGFGPLNIQNIMSFWVAPAMVAQFWQDADIEGVAASQIWPLIYDLVKNIHKMTDLQLWAAPGLYTLSTANPGGVPGLNAVYMDPAVGNEQGVGILVAELKSIE